MHHIFEFYEETFPDHNLKATTDFSLKNSKASPQTAQPTSSQQSRANHQNRESEFTTDIETPNLNEEMN